MRWEPWTLVVRWYLCASHILFKELFDGLVGCWTFFYTNRFLEFQSSNELGGCIQLHFDLGIAWIKFDDHFQVWKCSLGIQDGQVCAGATVVGLGKRGIQFNGLGCIGNRQAILLELELTNGSVAVNSHDIGVERESIRV